jgi:hypothetical protein
MTKAKYSSATPDSRRQHREAYIACRPPLVEDPCWRKLNPRDAPIACRAKGCRERAQWATRDFIPFFYACDYHRCVEDVDT